MGQLFLPALSLYARYAKHRLIRKTRNVDRAQAKFLKKLLKHHRNTELGRQWNLGEIRSIEEFQARVPVHPYSFYEPYVERMAAGEQNVLTPDRVIYLCVTSGSTGPRKRIPMTQRFQDALQRANVASIGFALKDLKRHGRSFGKILITNSVQILGKTSGGIEYGLASVGSLRMGRSLFEQTFAHPYDLLTVSDSPSRHYLCLLFAIVDQEVRGIANNFPMLVLRTCQYLEQYAEDFIRDLETGKLATWLTLDPETRDRLEQRWTANPDRAAELRQILQTDGRLTPKTVWPNLSFVLTARGGTSDFYFQRFPDYFGDTPIFGGVYGCSEATFGIAHRLNEDSMILAIESGFYEFVPPEQWDQPHPKTLLPSEVQVGQRYRILVTNHTGFYRYDIGDVVEVVGFYEKTPLIVFRHRQGGLLSSTSEKTTEFHVIQVMQTLQAEFGIALDDFCVTLSDDRIPAAYLVNIELSAGHTLADPIAFLNAFDRELKTVNGHYAVMRGDQVPAPRLRILAPGSFAIVRQRQLKQGMPDSQLKIPHISEDRQFLAGLEVQQEVRLEP